MIIWHIFVGALTRNMTLCTSGEHKSINNVDTNTVLTPSELWQAG